MRKPNYNFFHRLSLAAQGLFVAIRRERHMKVHLGLMIILLGPLPFVNAPVSHCWLMVILVTLLLITELINTAIETTIDLVTRRFVSYRAKLAKDMASGAVLIVAILVFFLVFLFMGRACIILSWEFLLEVSIYKILTFFIFLLLSGLFHQQKQRLQRLINSPKGII